MQILGRAQREGVRARQSLTASFLLCIDGFCGLKNVTGRWILFSDNAADIIQRFAPGVAACNDGRPCPTFPDNEVCKALYDECDVAVTTDSIRTTFTTPLPSKSVNRANSESAPGYRVWI